MAEMFLNEQGLTITKNEIVTGGKTYLLSKLASGQITRSRPAGGLLGLFKKHEPTFFLVITEGAASIPQTIYETKDAALADKITQAINKAIKARGGQRVR